MRMYSAAESFLLEFHRVRPGATALAFGDLEVTMDGRRYASSYEALATTALQAAPPGAVVLDVGCGNGHLLQLVAAFRDDARLVGIDMSRDELAAAPAALRSRASLVHARAQAMPLAPVSVDVAVSHLALMLMDDVDAVIAGIARVLKGGGTLAAVVGHAPVPSPAFDAYLELLVPHLQAASPPRLGDRRMRSEEGICELLSQQFDRVRMHELRIERLLSVQALWAVFEDMYDLYHLQGAQREAILASWLRTVQPIADAGGGLVSHSQRLRLFAAQRR